jgi:hypothetical protein
MAASHHFDRRSDIMVTSAVIKLLFLILLRRIGKSTHDLHATPTCAAFKAFSCHLDVTQVKLQDCCEHCKSTIVPLAQQSANQTFVLLLFLHPVTNANELMLLWLAGCMSGHGAICIGQSRLLPSQTHGQKWPSCKCGRCRSPAKLLTICCCLA